MALICTKCRSLSSARSRAMVVLPTPGGPQKIKLDRLPEASMTPSGASEPQHLLLPDHFGQAPRGRNRSAKRAVPVGARLGFRSACPAPVSNRSPMPITTGTVTRQFLPPRRCKSSRTHRPGVASSALRTMSRVVVHDLSPLIPSIDDITMLQTCARAIRDQDRPQPPRSADSGRPRYEITAGLMPAPPSSPGKNGAGRPV